MKQRQDNQPHPPIVGHDLEDHPAMDAITYEGVDYSRFDQTFRIKHPLPGERVRLDPSTMPSTPAARDTMARLGNDPLTVSRTVITGLERKGPNGVLRGTSVEHEFEEIEGRFPARIFQPEMGRIQTYGLLAERGGRLWLAPMAVEHDVHAHLPVDGAAREVVGFAGRQQNLIHPEGVTGLRSQVADRPVAGEIHYQMTIAFEDEVGPVTLLDMPWTKIPTTDEMKRAMKKIDEAVMESTTSSRTNIAEHQQDGRIQIDDRIPETNGLDGLDLRKASELIASTVAQLGPTDAQLAELTEDIARAITGSSAEVHHRIGGSEVTLDVDDATLSVIVDDRVNASFDIDGVILRPSAGREAREVEVAAAILVHAVVTNAGFDAARIVMQINKVDGDTYLDISVPKGRGSEMYTMPGHTELEHAIHQAGRGGSMRVDFADGLPGSERSADPIDDALRTLRLDRATIGLPPREEGASASRATTMIGATTGHRMMIGGDRER